MRHYDIGDDPRSAGTSVALKALAMAGRQLTHATGVVAVPNPDGTRTVIGGGLDVDRYVGDTVAPGRPTGITARCVARAVIVEWDGSLDGGVPADFDHVSVLLRPAGGTGEPADLGSLYAAGSVTTAQLDAGTSWDVTAVAVDTQGNRSPESDPVRVDVTDPIADAERRADELSDKVDRETQAAKDAADAAAKRADEAGAKADAMAGDITEVKRTVTEQGTKIEGAVTKADASLSVSTETKTALGELSTTVESHYTEQQATQDRVSKVEQDASSMKVSLQEHNTMANEALDRATTAMVTANGLKATVKSDYVSKADADLKYSTKSELEQRASGIEATVTEVRETADAAQESAASAKLTADGLDARVTKAQSDATGAVTKATEAQQTADGLDAKVTKALDDSQGALDMASSAQQTASGLRTEVEANYLSKSDAGATYYSKTDVDQRYDSIDSKVLVAESRDTSPSITPFFLRSPSDKGYWANASRWKQELEYSSGDGWAWVECDSSGGDNYPGVQVARGAFAVMPGEAYTMLVEMRGMGWTGDVTLSLDSESGDQHGMFEPLTGVPIQSGTRRFLLRARDSSGVGSATLAMRCLFRVPRGTMLKGHVRLCLFRGDHTGDSALAWKPYVEPQGTLVRQTAQGLSVGRTDGTGAFTGATYCDIDGSAFRVVGAGGTVLSRFAADMVELGRNSTTASVRLCGGLSTFTESAVRLLGGAATFATKAISLGATAVDAVISLCAGKGRISYQDSPGLTVQSEGNLRLVSKTGGYTVVGNTTWGSGSSVEIAGDRISIGRGWKRGSEIRGVWRGSNIVRAPAVGAGGWGYVTVMSASGFKDLVGRDFDSNRDWVQCVNADWDAVNLLVVPMVQGGNVICFLCAPYASTSSRNIRINWVIVAGA